MSIGEMTQPGVRGGCDLSPPLYGISTPSPLRLPRLPIHLSTPIDSGSFSLLYHRRGLPSQMDLPRDLASRKRCLGRDCLCPSFLPFLALYVRAGGNFHTHPLTLAVSVDSSPSRLVFVIILPLCMSRGQERRSLQSGPVAVLLRTWCVGAEVLKFLCHLLTILHATDSRKVCVHRNES